ncbi:MAG: ABC transporter permease [Elusimicrobia bacterium]|nr:ABC transporter permease [Elusimicrobiota bacterium]
MNAAMVLAVNTWRQLLRTRFLPVVVLFGGVLVYLGLLLGALAGDVEPRVLLDVGMAVVEVMTCGALAYCAASGVLLEIEQKTLYLILTRPVPRPAFLLGRYAGAVAASATAAAAMTACVASVLLVKGAPAGTDLLLALWGALLKGLVTAAVATLLALVSTSVLSAMTMTGVVWVLGHFVAEIRFLAQHTQSLAAKALLPAVWLLPDFALLNYRDRLHLPGAGLGESLALGALYAVLYSAVCLGLTTALFRRREF